MKFGKITVRPSEDEQTFLEDVANRLGARSVTETIHGLFADCMRFGIGGYGDSIEKRQRNVLPRDEESSTDIEPKSSRKQRSPDSNEYELQTMVVNLQWMLSNAIQRATVQQQQIGYLK